MNNFQSESINYQKILTECRCILDNSCTDDDMTEFGEKPGEYIQCAQVLDLTDTAETEEYRVLLNGGGQKNDLH